MGWKRAPRYTVLTLGYAALLQLGVVSALMLRFDGVIPAAVWNAYIDLAPGFTLLSLAGFLIAGLFHGLWRYAGTVTLFQIFKGVTLSTLSMLVLLIFGPRTPFTAGFVPLLWLCEMALMGSARLAWRLWRERTVGPLAGEGLSGGRAQRTLIVGAGPAGVHLAQEMRRGAQGTRRFTPVGFADEDPVLLGKHIEGLRVLGPPARLAQLLDEFGIEAVVVSSPDRPASELREITAACERAGARIMTLAGLAEASPARAMLARIRDVRIDDLLGRVPVKLDPAEIAAFLRGQRVLVTGAGGSIGAELARQAAGFGPAALGLLDHAENGLYYVQYEIAERHPALPLDSIVADLKDAPGIEEAFRRFRPTVVLHAAAHKHVPLLEANPREAVLNNVVATLSLIQAAERHQIEKFVLISSDKAVRPSSVMGATKRVCEMLIQARAAHSRTRFVAVRFGNVLGSEGSVVPLFQRQLERGGPLTVTHPEARRYFMTVAEAARLVLQASAMGRGGEVFVLDMGEQMRILDLARHLIRLAGLREGTDIEIAFTGLRPGEKLVEELNTEPERARMTQKERILVWNQEPIDEPRLLAEVEQLEAVARAGNGAAIRQHLRGLVPDYQEAAATPAPAPVAVAAELPALTRPPQAAPVALAAPPRPLATASPAPSTRRARPDSGLRRATDALFAAVGIALSSPLWALVWLEARANRRGDWLDRRLYVGRSRRSESGRERGAAVAAGDGGESRAVDLLGAPLRCARFRGDLGPLSRACARRGLDRLPMLLNVVRGEMAVVGPTPVPQGLVARWKDLVPDAELRFSVRPGVTGLAQLSGDSEEDVAGLVRRAALDLDYVERRSPWLDLGILLRTAGTIIAPRSAAQHDQPRSAAPVRR